MKKLIIRASVILTGAFLLSPLTTASAFALDCPLNPAFVVSQACSVAADVSQNSGVLYVNTGALIQNDKVISTNANQATIFVNSDSFTLQNSGTVKNIATGYLGFASAILSYGAGDISITNTGVIATANASLSPFSATSYSSYAIQFGNINSLTLNNGSNGIIAAGLTAIAGSPTSFSITNSGTIVGAGNSGINLTSNAAGPNANFISNLGTGVISGGSYGISMSSAHGFTITNRGTITGGVAGISLGPGTSNVTLNNYGTISGGTSAVRMTANGAGSNTINIYNGAVFANGIDYANTTGNTTNFYTGSYTLQVKGYALATNTINLLGTGKTLVTSGVDGTGNGNIVVVDNTASTSANSTAPVVANYASAVIGDVLQAGALVQQDIGIGDVISQDGGGTSSSPPANAYIQDTASAAKTSRIRAAFAEVLGSSAGAKATDLVMRGSGQTIDRYGNLVWSRTYGGAYFQDPYGTVSGSRAYSGGTMLGYDWYTDGWRVGGFLGLGRMRSNQSLSLDYVTTDMVYGGVYGRRSFDNFNLDASFTGGSLNQHARRFVNNGTELASGDFNGYFLAPEVALGYNVDLGDGITVTPTGRTRYVGSFLNAYTETGSSQNVSYGASTAGVIEERGELRLARKIKSDDGLASSIYVQAAAIAAQRIGPSGFTANLQGTSFAVGNGYARSKFGGSLGLGFTYKVAPQFDIYGGIDGAMYTDKSYSASARGGFKVAF
jgi:hypothetical protein